MKTIPFNINDYVRVKLTPKGRELLQKQHAELNEKFPGMKLDYQPPKEDAAGWSRWQLWSLMRSFGPSIWLGGAVPFETNIEFETEP